MPGQGAFAQSNAEDPRVPGTMLAEASTFDALPFSTEDVMLSQRVFMFSLGVLLPVLLFDFLFSGIGYGAYVMNWRQVSRKLDADLRPDWAWRDANLDNPLLICSDNCTLHANNSRCDDGGPSSQYSECAIGTDCTDVRRRARPPPPPTPRGPAHPPPSGSAARSSRTRGTARWRTR